MRLGAAQLWQEMAPEEKDAIKHRLSALAGAIGWPDDPKTPPTDYDGPEDLPNGLPLRYISVFHVQTRETVEANDQCFNQMRQFYQERIVAWSAPAQVAESLTELLDALRNLSNATRPVEISSAINSTQEIGSHLYQSVQGGMELPAHCGGSVSHRRALADVEPAVREILECLVQVGLSHPRLHELPERLIQLEQAAERFQATLPTMQGNGKPDQRQPEMQGDGLGRSDEEKVGAYLNTQRLMQEKDPKKWVELIAQSVGVSATKLRKMKVWQEYVAERLQDYLQPRPRATGPEIHNLFGLHPGRTSYLKKVWDFHLCQQKNSKEVRICPMENGPIEIAIVDATADPQTQVDERGYVIDSLYRSMTDEIYRSTLTALSPMKKDELADYILGQISYDAMTSDDGNYQAAVSYGESWLDEYSAHHPPKDYRRSRSKAKRSDR